MQIQTSRILILVLRSTSACNCMNQEGESVSKGNLRSGLMEFRGTTLAQSLQGSSDSNSSPANLESVRWSAPRPLRVDNLMHPERCTQTPMSFEQLRRRRMSAPQMLEDELDDDCGETPGSFLADTPNWDSWQEFAVLVSRSSTFYYQTLTPTKPNP